MPDTASTQALTSLLSMVFIAVTFIAAIGLFVLLILIRRPKKDLELYPIKGRQELSDNEASYFSYIKYNEEVNSIVLKQSQIFKKCVVTLIIKKGKTLKSKKYNLVYQPGDVFCGIKVEEGAEEFRVVLESVEGVVTKHPAIDAYGKFNFLYAIVVSVLFVLAGIFYVATWSYSLIDYWPGYAFYYSYIALVIIYFVIVLGGYFIGETLSKKGVF